VTNEKKGNYWKILEKGWKDGLYETSTSRGIMPGGECSCELNKQKIPGYPIETERDELGRLVKTTTSEKSKIKGQLYKIKRTLKSEDGKEFDSIDEQDGCYVETSLLKNGNRCLRHDPGHIRKWKFPQNRKQG
jgi:hypothetical protein